MAKKQRWKAVRVSVSNIKPREFWNEDLDAFARGDISVKELLDRETLAQGLGLPLPPEYGELLKSSIQDLESGSRCMYPNCGEPPIDAHMLSKANWLGTLSEDDTVLKINEDAPGRRIFLDKVKVGRVSTERCFCAEHDNDLFHMLDTSGYSMSAEWSFKLAYRLLCGITSGVEKLLKQLENTLEISANLHGPDPFAHARRRYYDSQLEHIRVKKLMDEALLKEDWDVIESNYWEIPTEEPTVAAAGVTSLDDVCQKDRNNDKARIFVACVPKQRKTLVIASSLKENSVIVGAYLERIGVLGKSGQDPEAWPLLSKLLLRHCRYFCIKPSFLEAKSTNEWKKVLLYWYMTDNDTFHDLKYDSDEVLKLFRGLGV